MQQKKILKIVFSLHLMAIMLFLTQSSMAQNYLWNEEFAPDLTGIDTVSVGGAENWIHDTYGHDSNCAKISGYSGSPMPNEDWIISPSMDLSNYSDAGLLFAEAINYSGGPISDKQEVMVSTNYSGDPASATWTELTVTGRSPGNTWNFNDVDTVDLSSYVGNSSVHVAFKYTSDTIDAATWEIDYAHVFGTSAGSPSMSLSKNMMDSFYYTVGNGPSDQDTLSVSGSNIQDSLHFKAPSDFEVSLSPQSGYSNTLVVDDTSGSITNAEVYVRMKSGLAEGYYTGYLNVVTSGAANDSIELKGSVDPAPSANVFWFEEFRPDITGLDTVNVQGNLTWYHNNYGADNNCIVISGYDSTSHQNEDWLISPDMDFSGHDSLKMTFSEAINYSGGNIADYQEVYVSTDYDGDPTAATWTGLTVTSRAPGDSWNFTEVDTVDLSAYAGEPEVNVGFKYTSTDTSTAIWEIDYVEVLDTHPTSIKENDKKLVSQPVVINEKIRFDLEAKEEMAIRLYNVNGQMIRSYSSDQFNGKASIPVQNIQRQMLILTVQGQKHRESFKLIP